MTATAQYKTRSIKENLSINIKIWLLGACRALASISLPSGFPTPCVYLHGTAGPVIILPGVLHGFFTGLQRAI